MNITKETANNKEQLLKYFRDRYSEFLAEVNGEYGNTEYKENQILRLVYSYDSIPKQTVKDRSPQHFGTMYFDVVNNGDKKELCGDYWTGRETTGRIELEFWKTKYLEKYPEELGNHPVTEIRKDE